MIARRKRAKRALTPGRPRPYDCSRCPAYCCSIYQRVEVGRRDLVRLAAHLGLGVEEVTARHTRAVGGVRVLRRQPDPVLGRACGFLDLESRRCSVYAGRPSVCRAYPGQGRCAYYDVLEFERGAQGDAGVLPLFQIRFPGAARPR